MDDAKWEAFANLSNNEFESHVDDITTEIREMLIDKRASYGPDNLTDFGDTGILVRTWDKLKRLKHMWSQGKTTTEVGEDAVDAWRDVCGYALLMLVAQRMGEAQVSDGHKTIRTQIINDDSEAWPPADRELTKRGT